MTQVDDQTVLRENRALRKGLILACVLIGPGMVLGYFKGRLDAPAPERAAAAAPLAAAEPILKQVAQAVPEPPPSAPAPRTDAPGRTYLQLAASTKELSLQMAATLQSRGFDAKTQPVPGEDDTWRVLVGPLDPEAAADTRARLVREGFPGDQAFERTW